MKDSGCRRNHAAASRGAGAASSRTRSSRAWRQGQWTTRRRDVAAIEAVACHLDGKCRRGRFAGRSDHSDDAPGADQAPGDRWQPNRHDELFGRRTRLIRADHRACRANTSRQSGMPPAFTHSPVPHRQAQAVGAPPQSSHGIVQPLRGHTVSATSRRARLALSIQPNA
jgi:hypothetical protein